MGFFTCVQKQLPEFDGNGETTLEEGETNPLDVPLDDIAENLLSFLNEFKSLSQAKKKIEKKYEMKKEHGDCWPADDIKRAWGQTRTMNIKSNKRRYWAHVIILQMLKRFMVHDECKPNAAQKDHDDTTNETKQSCETTPGMKENSEDRSSQSKAELETVGAAGGDEQMLGEENKLSEISRLSEDSGVASESQHSASSTNVAPLPTEVNPIANSNNSETKNAALVTEDEDTLVNNNDQRKDVDDYELYVDGMHDPENEILEDCLGSTDYINQACGKAESIKGNSEDISSQGNDELKTETAAEGVEGVIGSQGGTGTQFPAGSQETVNSQAGADVSVAPSDDEKIMDIVDEYNYICIPLSVFGCESTTESLHANTNTDPNADTNLNYTYKLIDQFPSNNQCCIYKKKSYVMLYDTDKKNAKWVYEILNKSTVPHHYKKVTFKKDDQIDDDKQALDSKNGFNNKDFVRGHLAAAANHMWCQEAYRDTYLISNMTPQLKTINNGIWKTLENYCRSIIYEDDEVRNVHVYTGPLYLNNNGGLTEKGKAVPTHYFKIVIMENENGKAKVECYKVENKKKESKTTDNISTDNQQNKKKREKIYLRDYSLDIKTIQEISGLTFIHKSDNNRVIVKKTLTCTGENESKCATIEVKCIQ